MPTVERSPAARGVHAALAACMLLAAGCADSTVLEAAAGHPAPAAAGGGSQAADPPAQTGEGRPAAPGDAPAAAHSPGLNTRLDYVDRRSRAFSRFRGWVDRAVAGDPGYNFSAVDAVTMYRLAGRQAYCDLAVQLVEDQVAAAEAAIAKGGFAPVAGNSYLEAGHAIGALAATWDACRASLDDARTARWKAYADRTIANIWDPRRARWGEHAHPWTGWATDNPGNNYYYSFLAATMSWALASGDPAMLQDLRERRIPPLLAYFGRLPGGGSSEGTGYGVSHMNLFPLYALWQDATGEDLANANSHLTDSIHYWIHATVPGFTHYAPIGDQARYANPEIFDYHRALMLHARALTRDDRAREAASWWLRQIPVSEMGQGFNFRTDLLPAGEGGAPPPALLHHATGVGHLFARTDWGPRATWVSIVAGKYDESHAHQDQGSFTLFARDWLAVTANIWTRSGINQATTVHNVVRFERSDRAHRQCQAPLDDVVVQQCHGTRSTLEVVPGEDGAFTAVADLTPAYAGNPAVRSWRRHFDFRRGALTVRDEFSIPPGTEAIFQLHVRERPAIDGPVATSGRLRMTVLEPAGARLSAQAWPQLGGEEFREGWRIEVRGGERGYLVRLEER